VPRHRHTCHYFSTARHARGRGTHHPASFLSSTHRPPPRRSACAKGQFLRGLW
jgi:hypothetical protein